MRWANIEGGTENTPFVTYFTNIYNYVTDSLLQYTESLLTIDNTIVSVPNIRDDPPPMLLSEGRGAGPTLMMVQRACRA